MSLLYLIIYIRTSKLKPKPETISFLTERMDFRCYFGLIYVKTSMFCTKNGKNKSDFEVFLVFLQEECAERVVTFFSDSLYVKPFKESADTI